MLDGYEEAMQTQNDSRFSSNNRYEWSYGKSNAGVGYGGYTKDYSSAVTSYKDNSVAAKSSAGFKFRTAESFLNNLGQTKKGNDIDLSGYKSGVKVYHKKFGEGIINKVETEGEDLKVDISFEKVGHKRLMAKFAGLEIME